MLKDKLRQQEELLIKVQHDISSDGSQITQPKLDVTQELVQILQDQRDELLSKVRFVSYNVSFTKTSTCR